MKRQSYHHCGLPVVMLACFTFAGSQASNLGAFASTTSMAAPSKNAGLLTIRRAPKFGTRVTLNVSIDGAQVASLGEGQSYNGTLSPGKHVISVNVTPGRGRGGTATKHITVKAGQTYSFTASWSSDRVVLL
jgi:hypothetical protein